MDAQYLRTRIALLRDDLSLDLISHWQLLSSGEGATRLPVVRSSINNKLKELQTLSQELLDLCSKDLRNKSADASRAAAAKDKVTSLYGKIQQIENSGPEAEELIKLELEQNDIDGQLEELERKRKEILAKRSSNNTRIISLRSEIESHTASSRYEAQQLEPIAKELPYFQDMLNSLKEETDELKCTVQYSKDSQVLWQEACHNVQEVEQETYKLLKSSGSDINTSRLQTTFANGISLLKRNLSLAKLEELKVAINQETKALEIALSMIDNK